MKPRHPLTLRIAAGAGRLEIDWDDRSSSSLHAGMLREQCRCTECRQVGVKAQAGITLAEVLPYGANAVRLVFSDGHERGIFPFSYLGDIA